MARPPKVDHVRDDFVKAVESALKLYEQVQQVGTIRGATNCPRLHAEHVRRVIELAFMGIVSAWEEFIERALVRYLAGAKTDSGYLPTLRLGAAKSLDHAYQVLTGDPSHDPARHFVSWNDPAAVSRLAKLYFDGGRPFSSTLESKCQNLNDATRLRNRVAHSSTKCREDFKIVARRFKGMGTDANLSQGYRVGDLLLEKAIRHFGNRAQSKGWTFFEAYCEMYREAAKAIVP